MTAILKSEINTLYNTSSRFHHSLLYDSQLSFERQP